MNKSFIILSLALSLSSSALAQQQYSLEQVKQMALEHNMAMRSANHAIQQAEEQKKEAFTNYFPQVSAIGMGFKTTKDIIDADINTSDILPASLAAAIPSSIASTLPTTIPIKMINRGVVAGVSAIQPIFMGGQIVNGNKLAKVNVEAKKLQSQTSSNTVELTAEQYYWQIVTIKEKQKTVEAVSEMLKKLEKDANVAIKAGVSLRNDLLAVQLKQNELESNKLKLANGLKLSQMVLAQYIGKDGEQVDVSTIVDPSQLPDYPMVKVNHDQAVTLTPEYQLLEKNVEATSLQRKMEVGKHMPSIGIGAGYSYQNFGDGINNNAGAVFATVSVPISSWWGGSHAIKRKKIAEDDAREQLADNTQLLKIRMQKNWDDMDDAYKQLQLAKKSIEQSEENLRLNRDFYYAGTVTMNDLLDAQQKYQQCRDRYTDAYAQLQIKIVEYKQSVGE